MKVLIIRSCHLMQFHYVCHRLKKKYPSLTLCAIVQKDVAAVVEEQGFVDELILTEEHKPFSSETVTLKEINRMRQQHYDLFVIPYNNHTGVRYQEVEKIARLSNASKVLTIKTDGREKSYSRFFWKLKIVQKKMVALGDRFLFALLGSVLLLFACIAKVIFLWLPKKENKKITFITPQNYNYPSARVRVYDFMSIYKAHGYTCDVIAYDDMLVVRSDTDPIPEEMLDSRKLFVNIVVFLKLLFLSNSSFFYIQKVKYNAIAPYLLSFIKQVNLIIDLDDNEFSSPVFNFLKSDQLLCWIAKKEISCVLASHKLVELTKPYTPHCVYAPTVVDLKKFFVMESQNKDDNEIVFGWGGIVFGPPVLENVQYIFKCFKALNKRFENVVLRVAIRGPLMDLVNEDLETNYRDCRIEIVEWLPIEKMNAFYNSLDVGLNPLIRDDLFTQCKSPTKLFEYMACGLPSITHDVGEAKHIIQNGENGFLVTSEDDFIGRMIELVENKTLRIQMGKRARQTIEETYSLNAVEDTLLQIVTKKI